MKSIHDRHQLQSSWLSTHAPPHTHTQTLVLRFFWGHTVLAAWLSRESHNIPDFLLYNEPRSSKEEIREVGKQETRSCPFYPPHPSLVSPSSSSYLLNVLVTRAYVSARTSPHCASMEKRIRTPPQKTGPVTSDLLLLYNSLVVKTVKDGRRWRNPHSQDKNKGSRRTWWIQRERE